MDGLVQLLRITPASAVQKKWCITDDHFEEIVKTQRLPIYTIREKRIHPDGGKTVYFCEGPKFYLFRENDFLDCPPLDGDRGNLVLDGLFFNSDDIEAYEVLYPELLWPVAAEGSSPSEKTDWNDCSVIQDFESLPSISDSLCRQNIVLAIDADGSTCPPHLATLPLKIFFTEMPKPDEGEYYTSADLMERYKLSPAEFVNYLATHEDLYPYGVPDYHFSSNYVMSKKIEALGKASFHYRDIQHHEKSMQENGHYDKDYNARQRRTIQNEVNPSDDTPRVAELEAQLAQAQTIIAELKANLPQEIDFSGGWTQDSPDYIVAVASMGDTELAKDLIAEKDARIAKLEANLSEIQAQEAYSETAPSAKIEQGRGDGTWEDSVTAACKAIFYVLEEGRRDWVSGKEPGTGETDSGGKETFRALLKRLHPNTRRCLVKAESAAWKVLSDNGYTHLGGRKPNP